MTNITNIERFAIHDGPGIRTTVFFKGCPLHCPWCANPETQESKPTLMYEQTRCVACQRCEQNCSQQAIYFQEDKWHYHKNKCNQCRKCEEVCYQEAIQFQGKELINEQILQEVLKDKVYYEHSSGGITISGGEPLAQKDNLIDLLKKCKEAGLHTAIETTGQCTLSTLQEVMPYVDLFLYDFKHIDENTLQEVIGANGKVIKENLKYLLLHQQEVEVRIPVIYGFNEKDAILKQMIDYLASINVKKLSLLPYHNLGKSKYEKMQKTYTLDYTMMPKEKLEPYKQYAISLDIYTKIGG